MPIRLSALVAVLFALVAPATAQPLRIATEGAYPPWNTTSPDGKLIGFEVDLAQDLCRRMQVECDIIAQDWDGILPGLQQGRYDAVMAGVSITEERAKTVDFSTAYAADPAVFAVAPGSPLIATFPTLARVDLDAPDAATRDAIATVAAALRGRTVAVQTSTNHARMMVAVFPDVTVRTYDKADYGALDLAAGRVDALLGARSAIGTAVAVGPSWIRGPLGNGVGVAVRKGDTLSGRISAAIAQAAADGTTAALSQRWFGHDVSVR